MLVQDHKSGLLFDLNLDFSLFEKLMLIESDLKLRKKLSEGAYVRVKTNFDIKLMVNSYVDLYKKLIND